MQLLRTAGMQREDIVQNFELHVYRAEVKEILFFVMNMNVYYCTWLCTKMCFDC